VAYNEHVRARDMDEAQQALDAFRQNAAQAADSLRRDVQASARQRAVDQWREREHRRLALDQRCVAGAVVEVHGNAYTQLGTIAQPIHCAGEFADQPLR
jgi:hypothetical protein